MLCFYGKVIFLVAVVKPYDSNITLKPFEIFLVYI